MILACETGIAPGVWAAEGSRGIATALDYLLAKAKATKGR